MRIGNVASTLVRLYNNPQTRKRTVLLVGASGIGKSSVVHQAAKMLDIAMYDMRVSTSDPTNFGMLMPDNGEMVRVTPDFIAFAKRHPEGGILFLDEITSAPPAVQAPAYQITLDHGANGEFLPDTWMVVAAGNRQSDRGVTFPMASPLCARMTRIDVESVLEDVMFYGAQVGLDPCIMAFLQDRADMVHKFDPKTDAGVPFPNQRSWFAVSDKLAVDFDPATRAELIAGDVGREAAALFEAFLRVWESMPSIDSILTDPDSVEVPEALNVRYCVAMGLSARLDRDNFANAWSFLQRMPKELGTLVVKLAYTRDRSIARSPSFTEWASVNQSAWKRS
jgi:hypothetical protein